MKNIIGWTLAALVTLGALLVIIPLAVYTYLVID